MSIIERKNKIILGTAQFGMNYGINNLKGKIPQNEINNILEYSYINGIRSLDTAEAYGTSINEIGEFHRLNPSHKFKIYSKLNPNQINDNFLRNLSAGLKKLSVDSYEGYMIHDFIKFKKTPELALNLFEAKKMGLIKKVGISLYSNEDIKDVINKFDFDFIQLPFNLLDNSFQRKNIIKDSNIEIHIRSIFLQGLFFMPSSLIPEKLKPLCKHITMLEEFAYKNNSTVEEIAIKYPFSKNYIDKIIFGVDNLIQLKRNIKIIDKPNSISYKKIDSIRVLEKELLNPSNW